MFKTYMTIYQTAGIIRRSIPAINSGSYSKLGILHQTEIEKKLIKFIRECADYTENESTLDLRVRSSGQDIEIKDKYKSFV